MSLSRIAPTMRTPLKFETRRRLRCRACLIVVAVVCSGFVHSIPDLLNTSSKYPVRDLYWREGTVKYSQKGLEAKITGNESQNTPWATAQWDIDALYESQNFNKFNVPRVLRRMLRKYDQKKLSNPSTSSGFILTRVIGNNLPPLHGRRQTYSNLKDILQNEEELPGLDRRWYINRIANPKELLEIVRLLIKHQQTFTINLLNYDSLSTFDSQFEFTHEADLLRSEYFRYASPKRKRLMVDRVRQGRNLLVGNINGARNDVIHLALEAGAEYVLPWDATCVLSLPAWQKIQEDIELINKRRYTDKPKYFAVPVVNRFRADDDDNSKSTMNDIDDEPQLIFHQTSLERFNPTLRYGGNSKIELLLRLKIPGPWSDYEVKDYWEEFDWTFSLDVGKTYAIPSIGWVDKLSSGRRKVELQGKYALRQLFRSEGLENVITDASEIDARTKFGFNPLTTMIYDEKNLQENLQILRNGSNPSLIRLVSSLLKDAQVELQKDVRYTVVRKTTLPPSGDPHDYLSWAPDNENGSKPTECSTAGSGADLKTTTSSVQRLHSDETACRTMVQFVEKTTILALAGYFSNNTAFYEKAAGYVRDWFVSTSTRMNPNLKYAHLSPKYSENESGKHTGIVEGTSFVLMWDSIRLVYKAGHLSETDFRAIQKWARQYIKFLNSTQAKNEYYARDYHGTLFDVQAASTYALTKNFAGVLRHTDLARGRLLQHYSRKQRLFEDCESGVELRSKVHNIQAWTWLATMSQSFGLDIFAFKRTHESHPIICNEIQKLIARLLIKLKVNKKVWEKERMLLQYLLYNAKQNCSHMNLLHSFFENGYEFKIPKSVFDIEPVSAVLSLLPPYWNLAMPDHLHL